MLLGHYKALNAFIESGVIERALYMGSGLFALSAPVVRLIEFRSCRASRPLIACLRTASFACSLRAMVLEAMCSPYWCYI